MRELTFHSLSLLLPLYSLYGWTSGASGWIVWTVNFTSVFSRYCTDNDYYTWSPWDEVGVARAADLTIDVCVYIFIFSALMKPVHSVIAETLTADMRVQRV